MDVGIKPSFPSLSAAFEAAAGHPPPGLPWGLVLLDAGGHVLSMDGGAEAVFGLVSPAVAGQAFGSLVAAPWGLALGQQAPAPGTAPAPEWQRWPTGCQARRGDGSLVAIDLSVKRLAHDAAAATGAAFVAFIHQPAPAAPPPTAPSPVERQLRALIELAPIAVWVAESDRVVLANRAAGQLMGLDSGADLIGRSVFSLLHASNHDELARRLDHAVRHEGQVEKLQAHLLCRHQESQEVEIALAGLPDHGRTSVQMVVSNVTQRNQELREIQRSRHRLKRLSANVVEAREEERQRIARELHDDLSQRLSALKMDIVDCAGAHAVANGDDRVVGLLRSMDDMMSSVRRIASNLRPPMLDDLGLADAIEALAADFSRRQGIGVRLRLQRLEEPLAEKVAIAAYRMVQEALTNVARHAQATEVQIELRCSDDELTLSVRDDGIGLTAPAQPQRDSQFGLLGMHERADALGGSLDVESLRDGGVCLVIHLPVGRPGRADGQAGGAAGRHAS